MNHSISEVSLRPMGTAVALFFFGLPLCAQTTRSASQESSASQTTLLPVAVHPLENTLQINDTTLKDAIVQRLKSEGVLPGKGLQVSVDHHVVTFHGTFPNASNANRAVEAASSVRGVLSVDNLAEIAPTPRPDNQVQEDVLAALHHDPATRSLSTEVSVKDGVVTLSGSVRTWQEKDLVQWVAENVRGVRRVQNQVAIHVIPRTDSDIAAQIRRRLGADALLNDGIDVSVNDGVATLSGNLDSAVERNWSIADARVPGVQKVVTSGLTVNAKRGKNNAATNVAISDEDVRRSIIDGYAFDPRVKAYVPSVSVSQGVVTLTGTVASVKSRQAAVQIAQHTRGVRKVEDKLEVRADDRRTDADIEQDILAALKRSSTVKPDEVKVQVENGVAHLTGSVDTFLERWIAEDIASRTSGVAQVKDTVQVRGAPAEMVESEYFYYPSLYSREPWLYSTTPKKKTDADITQGIRRENFWDPFIQDDTVSVTVQQGVATLSGTVPNEFEKRVAQENAYRGGAWRVVNNLKVRPQSNGIATTN